MPTSLDALESVSTTKRPDVINGLAINQIESHWKFECNGHYIINDGFLKSTPDHIHIVNRGGNWIARKTCDLVVGDYFLNLDGTQREIVNITYDRDTRINVWRLNIEPNDVYFANGILTHNKKGENGFF